MLSISPRQGDQPKTAAGGPAAAVQALEPSAAAPASAAADDNRTAARYPASAIPAITGLRFSPHGVEATMLNISETGLLAEVSERLKPGSAVTAVFEGTFTPNTAEGRVARTTVSAMGKDGRLRYHVGISFSKPCVLDAFVEAPPEPEPEVEPAPAPVAAASAVVAPATPAAEAKPAPAPVVAQAPVAATPAPAPIKAAAPKPREIEIEIPLTFDEPVVRNRW